MKKLLIILVVLNLLDLVSTVVGIRLGFFEEMNPILANLTLWQLAAVKLVLLNFAIAVFWKCRKNIKLHTALKFVNFVYLAVMVRHLQCWKDIRDDLKKRRN